jgi:hypothetical protein
VRDVTRLDGIAIHRRVGKGRDVPLGADLRGQHAAAGFGQGDWFSVERGDLIKDPLARLGDRQ